MGEKKLCAAFSRKNCPTCWQFCYPGLIRPGHIGNSYLPGKSNGKFSEPATYGADSCLPLMPLKYHQYIQVNQMMCPHPLEDAHTPPACISTCPEHQRECLNSPIFTITGSGQPGNLEHSAGFASDDCGDCDLLVCLTCLVIGSWS